MEFLNKHQEITNLQTTKIKEFVIEQFKIFKKQGRSVEYAIDNTKTKIYNIYIVPNFINKYYTHFENVYTQYLHSFDNYGESNDLDVTRLVLQNEMLEEFESFGKINKNLNFKYDKDFDNLTFEDFVGHLLKFDVAKKISNQLSNNFELYKLFYENDYYKELTFENYPNHVVNNDKYRKIYSKFYPNAFIPIATKRINEFQQIIYDIIRIEDKGTPKVKSNKHNHDFEIDEQALVLNLCLIDIKTIPLTEKIKLLILIGEIKDKSIFGESSSNNQFYQKVNKGILRNGSSATMLDTINSILNKIENQNLNITNQTLKKHKTTLISEQNNTKK